VIDACTAAESALSERIQVELTRRSVPADARKTVTDQANGVVGLSQLANSLQLSLPVSIGKIRAQLAGARNRAVHQGDTLTEEAATAALRLAQDLVKTVSPPPSPSSIHRGRS
jgi:hypothetical protein